jgi:hypothetical protein
MLFRDLSVDTLRFSAITDSMTVARESMPAPCPTAPWPDAELQDLFIEVVPELVDIARLAATVTEELEIARQLDQRLPGPYGQDFIDALIAVVQHMFPLRRQGLIEALHQAGVAAEADTRRFGSDSVELLSGLPRAP